MNATEQRTIKYENPPLNEIIGGIHFDSIKGLQAGHLGILWQKLGPNFTSTEDHNLLPSISDQKMNFPALPPLRRTWFIHKDEHELIQIQFDRFVYNWRKGYSDSKYPGYPTFIGNFERYLFCLQELLSEQKLGDFTPRQYEIAYTNNIFQNEGWETVSNLEKVFPNFISYKGQNTLPSSLRDINYQLSFNLPDNLGLLNLSIRNGQQRSDKRHLLRVEFRAINSQPSGEMRKWFDSAHDVILDVFSNLVSNEIQEKYWRRKS
jgi:uncharacterized protein (TIGR04255 family)